LRQPASLARLYSSAAMLEEGAPRPPITAVDIEPVSLAVFDELLSSNEAAA
jgi:hypothetical protein